MDELISTFIFLELLNEIIYVSNELNSTYVMRYNIYNLGQLSLHKSRSEANLY